MAFELYGEEGYLGRMASIEGYGELIEFAEKTKLAIFSDLVDYGYTAKPQELKKEIETFLKSNSALDSELKHTLNNLVQILGKAKEVAIVHG